MSDYENRINANEISNKHSIKRQREMLVRIAGLEARVKELTVPLNAPHSEALKLEAENKRLREGCKACIGIIGIKDIGPAKDLCAEALTRKDGK